MTTSRLPYLIIILFCLAGTINAQQTLPQLGKAPVAAVIKAMTLVEKAKLVVGKGFSMPGVSTTSPTVGQTQDLVPGAAGTTFAIPRLGIPSIVVSDGPAGVRIDSVRKDHPGKTYYATAWPTGTLLASSWDTSLVERVGKAFGEEVKEYGIDILLGPAMNIHRNPLGGRNFEYFSEDPLLAGSVAAAMVNGIEANGVGTSIKHFAANNQETDRNSVNTIISERALREIYLKGFGIAVRKAQPWTVMSSYNLINGTFASHSHDLLTGVLRAEWGFKGFVMTDWFGGTDAVAQMKAGNDLLMPGTPSQSAAIMEAVKNGSLQEAVLDKNIAAILNIVLKSPSFKKYKYNDAPDLKAHARLAREAAAGSMVLLKNEAAVLPLPGTDHRIALFGMNGYELIAGGTGSGDVNKAYKISLHQGLKNAGYAVDQSLTDNYTKYWKNQYASRPKQTFFEAFMKPLPPVPEEALEQDLIQSAAGSADVAVVAIGRNAGEGKDRQVDGDYVLTTVETALLHDVSAAFHAKRKKLVVVLNIGGVIDVTSWRDNADAILLAWQPGLEGGNAITDILSGKVNPSGKLATTFAASYADIPSGKNFPGKEFPEKAATGMMGMKIIPAEVTYQEGVFVGYRYFTSFGAKPAYPFGYGLSYTNFSYSKSLLSAFSSVNGLNVSLIITNTGNAAGREVVQLYLSAPGKTIPKPAEELKAFAKTKLLQPGQSEIINFHLSPADLASFDTSASAWVAEAGPYTVRIGASSEDIRQSGNFTLKGPITTEKVTKLLAPNAAIDELKPQ